MRVGKIFYIFNSLLVIKLLEPCLCISNQNDTIKVSMDELEVIRKKQKQNIIILSSVLGAALVALSVGLGCAYYNKNKNQDQDQNKLIPKYDYNLIKEIIVNKNDIESFQNKIDNALNAMSPDLNISPEEIQILENLPFILKDQ